LQSQVGRQILFHPPAGCKGQMLGFYSQRPAAASFAVLLEPFRCQKQWRLTIYDNFRALHLCFSLFGVTSICKKPAIALGYEHGSGTSGKTTEITNVGKMRDQQSVKTVRRQKATQRGLPALVLHQESVAIVWPARAPKTKPPVLCARNRRAVLLLTVQLCLNDARSDEENQLLIGSAHLGVFEQVAQVRNVSEQWHLSDLCRVLRLHDTANHHRSTICHQNLRRGLLRNQLRVALDRMAEVGSCILHVHVQEDGSFRSNLWNHSQAQESIHVGHRRRTAQLGLGHDGNSYALLYYG